MVSEAEMGWLAGIIDGEGTIVLFVGFRKGGKLNTASPQVIIGNTEKVMIEKVADIYGRLGVGVHIYHHEPKSACGVPGRVLSKYKTMYHASVVGFQRTQKLLTVISPYLITVKRQKAEAVLRFIEQRGKKIFKDGKFRCGQFQGSKYDIDDLTMIRDIVASGSRSKKLPLIEGLLRDYTQARDAQPRMI
jgi:hypothetical protein